MHRNLQPMSELINSKEYNQFSGQSLVMVLVLLTVTVYYVVVYNAGSVHGTHSRI